MNSERFLIGRLESQLRSANSLQRKARLGERIKKAKERLSAKLLAEALRQ